VLIISLTDFGCATISNLKIFSSRGNTYQYVYEMTGPVASKNLEYKASKFNIWFDIDQGAINITLRNLSSSPLSILAGNASIGINGKFSPARTSISYYTDSTAFQSTITVLSGGFTQDFFIPRNNIFYDGRKWTERVLFATRDYDNPATVKTIQKNIGAEVAFLLPIKIGAELTEHTFKFKVSSILVVNPDSVSQKGPRLPPPPKPKTPPTKMELWTTIGVASSMVIMSILIFTRNKPFPGGL
jgi:hypothetical protein